MTTTAFQTVIDYAETISLNKMKKVSQTVSRDGTVKSTSLGGQVWTFEVKLPNGLPWTTMRPLIEDMETLDRISTGTIRINSSGHSWITGYQGNMTGTSGIIASFSSGNTISLVSGYSSPSAGQFRFKAGDIIQLGSSGSAYTVAANVAYNETTVTLNRPVREAAGSYTLYIGQNVSWSVICVKYPKWTLFARNQVAWDGAFVFAEAI
jgi:hypothetical protein